MSKIAEQKALEAYPEKWYRDCDGDSWDANEKLRKGYIKGYDKAMKDIKQYVEELIKHEEKEWGERNVDFGLYTILGHIVKIEENEQDTRRKSI